MTYGEYIEKMDKYSEYYKDSQTEELYDEIGKFQQAFMNEVLNNYNADTQAKEYIRELLDYAINRSVSGNAIVSVPTKELADEIDNIIYDEIGDYLLDDVQIYQECDGWAVDVMFGGYFVPFWDGFLD